MSDDPHIQKWKLRSYIVAPPGHVLIQWDLSQAESWIVAYLSNDAKMKEFLGGKDIHTETAKFLLHLPKTWTKKEVPVEQRFMAKKCNHAFSYIMTVPRFVQVYNKEAVDNNYPVITAQAGVELRNGWLQLYPGVPLWWESIQQELNQSRTLSNCYGRLRTFFAQWGSELFKEATAFKPQSTVADHFNGKTHPLLGIKGGLREVYRQFGSRIKIINQSHDSLLAEVPKVMIDDVIVPITNLIKRPLVVNGEEFTIPVSVEMGERWGELEEVKI